MSKRFELINFAHDNFKDNKHNKKLDSFDVVNLLNHYDELQNILIERDNTIADLEAKLAESEKKYIIANNLRKNSDEVLLNYKTEKYGLYKTIQELRKMKLSLPEKEWYYKGFENCERQMSSYIADLTLEVKELKQQLAEKDEEIKQLNNRILISQLQAPEEQRLKIIGSSCCQYNPKRDKISFCIDKLSRVKNRINSFKYDEIKCLNKEDAIEDCLEAIDKQIEELKKEIK